MNKIKKKNTQRTKKVNVAIQRGNRFVCLFIKYKSILAACLLFLVVFVAFEKTLSMYFWHDDYPILYKLQKPMETAGTYGIGIAGLDSPYRYTAVPFVPFFPFFGLEPKGYYAIGILLYFFASLSTYVLTKIITGERKTAFAAALIFASGYVGSESLNTMGVSWQNILATILLTLTAACYFKFAKTKQVLFYVLSVVLYVFTMEFSHLRAHGIILLVFFIELLFNFKLFQSLIRMVPFVGIYWLSYMNPDPTQVQAGHLASGLISKIFIEEKFDLLLTPLKTLENIFIPDKLNFSLLVFLIILIILLIWARSKTLLYALIFTLANSIAYFLYWPDGFQETTHRYLNPSYVGASMFLAILIQRIFRNVNQFMYVLAVAFIVVFNIVLVRSEQAMIVSKRSVPSREFWKEFHNQVSTLQKNSLLYVDVKQDGESDQAYGNAIGVGAMGTTTSFAVQYGLRWQDIYHPNTLQEFLYLVSTNKFKKENIHTFFYGLNEGLVNTTKSTVESLFGPKRTFTIDNLDKIEIAFTSPLLLTMNTDVSVDFSSIDYGQNKQIKLAKYLDYLSYRNEYYNSVIITASSQSKYTEIRNIHDRNYDTSWKALTSYWGEHHNEEVTLDLGAPKEISGVKIIPGSILRLPTEYQYTCSLDGKTWESLTSITKKAENANTFIDKFSTSYCRFVKLTVYKTYTDEPPQISEIEVLGNEFVDLDPETAELVYSDPFQFVVSNTDEQVLLQYFSKNGIYGSICFYTDKYKLQDPFCKSHIFSLRPFSSDEVIVDSGGTILKKITLSLPPQVKIKAYNARLESLTAQELKDRNYIVEYAE